MVVLVRMIVMVRVPVTVKMTVVVMAVGTVVVVGGQMLMTDAPRTVVIVGMVMPDHRETHRHGPDDEQQNCNKLSSA